MILPTGFGKSYIFQLSPFVFYSGLGASESFILNSLMRDQTVKLDVFAGQLANGSEY